MISRVSVYLDLIKLFDEIQDMLNKIESEVKCVSLKNAKLEQSAKLSRKSRTH